MRVYIYVVFCIVVIATVLSACGSQPNAAQPNGQSELAALMREMQRDMNKELKVLDQPYARAEMPGFYDKLKTAVPTEANMKKDDYDAKADLFLESVNAYYSAAQGTRTDNYNAIINACKGCHLTHCPGPLKVINKMFVP